MSSVGLSLQVLSNRIEFRLTGDMIEGIGSEAAASEAAATPPEAEATDAGWEPALAIDKYLKSLKPVPSPLLVNGKLSPAAQRGEKLFKTAGCRT